MSAMSAPDLWLLRKASPIANFVGQGSTQIPMSTIVDFVLSRRTRLEASLFAKLVRLDS
jgi:hypothetical protein